MKTDGCFMELCPSLGSYFECISQLSLHRKLWFSYLKKRWKEANGSLSQNMNYVWASDFQGSVPREAITLPFHFYYLSVL